MAKRGRRSAISELGWDCFKPVAPWDVSLEHLRFFPPLSSPFRHISVGSDFQAELPELQSKPPSEDEEPASLVWKPWEEDDSAMEKPDRGSCPAFLPTPDILGCVTCSGVGQMQLFACSPSLLVWPTFQPGSVRGKENALVLQQSRKKNNFPTLQICQGHFTLEEGRLAP